MDNFFGIGLPELVLILVIAGLVMGPERIVRSARTFGVLTARLQNISRSFLRQLNAELDAVDDTGQIKSTVEELNLLRQQVADLRNEVVTLATGTSVLRDTSREIENSILPPTPRPKQKSSSKPQGDGSESGPVHRPPSLSVENSPPQLAPIEEIIGTPARQPVKFPKRVEVAEDPDS